MAKKSSPEPFYSMARRAGDILFLSGFGPVGNGEVVGANIEEQTIFTMDAMAAVLEKEGATFDNCVRVNVFLLDMADRDGFNKTYMNYFKNKENKNKKDAFPNNRKLRLLYNLLENLN